VAGLAPTKFDQPDSYPSLESDESHHEGVFMMSERESHGGTEGAE
jgi:hypothetical protein